MEYYTAKSNLIKLLCCNIETLSDEDLRKLVKKRYKAWHPDKNSANPDRFKEEFITLNESYKIYRAGPRDSGHFSGDGDDLRCDEEYDSSWEKSSDDSDYNSTPFDDDFFTASPKKNFAVPDPLRMFFRSKTNRRAGKFFMLFTFADHIHRKALEDFSKCNICKSFVLFEGRTNKEIFCCILVTVNEVRLIDVRKYIKKYSINNFELFYSVKVLQLLEECSNLYGEPQYESGEKLKKKTVEEKHFDNRALVDFAISHEYTEVYVLMYEYAHLADPCDRPDCTKDHEDDHAEQVVNAKKYVALSDRKKVAKNAIDCVIARMYRQLSSLTNLQWIEIKSRDFSERLSLIEDCKIFGQAYYYWKYVITREVFYDIMSHIMSKLTKIETKQPISRKKRYVCLRGLYNSGKTTFAAAICKFFDGVNVNVNVSKDRLPFYLGAAIGKRFVLFDDVKGWKSHHDLTTGPGLNNLDDLRDYLDGHIEVQLEKKNQNPVNQVFPMGIITMNKYTIPGSLKIRLKVVDCFPSSAYVRHPYPVTMDTIYLAMVMDNLIPCDKHFIAHFLKKKDEWIEKHQKTCCCLKVSHVFIMGIILSTLGAALSAIGGALASAGAAVVSGLASAGLYLGLITQTFALSVEGTALVSGLALSAEFAANIAAPGITLTATGYAITTLGYSVLAGGALFAFASTVGGLVAGLSRQHSRGAPPSDSGGLLPFLNNIPPLICRLSDNPNECRSRRMFTNTRVRTVRVSARPSTQRTVLSYATPSRVSRVRYQNGSKNGKTAKRRQVSSSNKRMRRKSNR